MNEKVRQKRRKRKLILLIIMTGLTSVILTVGTYAWFVGTSIARVNQFSVSVGAADGLELSLNGSTWTSTSLSISDAVLNSTVGYATSNNSWGYTYKKDSDGNYLDNTGAITTDKTKRVKANESEGSLTPVSTAGEVDATTGRLVFYGKSSLTATNGGYRLISQKVNNTTEEQPGYITFDLFIKNGSGDDYIATYNEADDEAIYLTQDSQASVVLQGSETDKGLANSLRVAFVQVGRVKTSTSVAYPAVIQSINCTSNGLGLCSDVPAAIWEPNDTKHTSEVVTYFQRVCKERTDESTYTATSCSGLTTTSDTNTYVVATSLTSADHIDVYDGLNTYVKNTSTGCTGCSEKLKNIDTFTDTEKNQTGVNRNEIFKLAPNSITKVRVYIYLEGQDVDNYDVATQNKTISISFGFTKDRWDMATKYGLS